MYTLSSLCRNNGGYVTVCDVDLGNTLGDASYINCIPTTTSDPTFASFTYPWAVAVHNELAYITNGATDVYVCDITSTGLSNCRDACPAGGCGLSDVQGIAISDDGLTAYLGDGAASAVVVCSISGDVMTQCATQNIAGFNSIDGIAVIGQDTPFQSPIMFLTGWSAPPAISLVTTVYISGTGASTQLTPVLPPYLPPFTHTNVGAGTIGNMAFGAF